MGCHKESKAGPQKGLKGIKKCCLSLCLGSFAGIPLPAVCHLGNVSPHAPFPRWDGFIGCFPQRLGVSRGEKSRGSVKDAIVCPAAGRSRSRPGACLIHQLGPAGAAQCRLCGAPFLLPSPASSAARLPAPAARGAWGFLENSC